MSEPTSRQHSTRVRVKICGITSPDDARLAANAGADAVGLNFHPPSPRAVDVQKAAAIARALPPFVAKVAVLVDPPAAQVAALMDAVPVDYLQFHGNESAAFCRSFGQPYIKATGVTASFDFAAFAREYADAEALLLDTFDPVRKGGTGQAFDWAAWPTASDRALILAGGLNPDNVAAAVAATRPFAVDVASGVEGPVPGRKDAARVARFVAAVANA